MNPFKSRRGIAVPARRKDLEPLPQVPQALPLWRALVFVDFSREAFAKQPQLALLPWVTVTISERTCDTHLAPALVAGAR